MSFIATATFFPSPFRWAPIPDMGKVRFSASAVSDANDDFWIIGGVEVKTKLKYLNKAFLKMVIYLVNLFVKSSLETLIIEKSFKVT